MSDLVNQLCALTRNWNDHDDIPRSQQLECTAIGKKLNEAGGKQAMVDAYYVAKGRNNSVHVVVCSVATTIIYVKVTARHWKGRTR